ncbi:MAG TPA: hypothetical protein VG734_14040 [Lacunisphaera sp.]|nr:hypothetical protein [Lacunisphaera sp.]
MSKHPQSTAFLCAVVAALAFALFTNHVWEDYYITFRSSKNLATGHGLVFNHGDRLHTFTSPLGVLLPAAASWLTGNLSDPAALWLFRLMCIAALGGAVALLVALARRLAWPVAAVAFVAALVCTDAKSLDFTINGMETAFMLLFLAYALWAHLTPGLRQWAHLGTAWAGLMWTRPDSFIYVGVVAIGFWIFNQPERTGGDRRQQFLLFLKAGLLTTALYGPWLAWAWWYYGTPVPHTIVAKGTLTGTPADAAHRFLQGVWQLPRLIWTGESDAEGAFLPAYFMRPSWPVWMHPLGRALATIGCVLWLVPRLRLEARVASFAYWIAISYLSFVPYFPFPWYFPPTTLLAYVALAGALGQLWSAQARWLSFAAGAVAAGLLASALWLTGGVARQVRAQQKYVEDGNRRVIGEWLHEHAQPGDTVFMEPLGYIGYFSGLKTYDWPGMSSREMPEAIRRVGPGWDRIILYLQPTWLVLRAEGEGDLEHLDPALAALSYDRVREFDRRQQIAGLDVPGQTLLWFDSRFILYHLRGPLRQDADGFQIASPIGSSIRLFDQLRMRLVHAPGVMIVPLAASARTVRVKFGFPDDAIEQPFPTDGAIFEIWLTDGKARTRLFSRHLQPYLVPDDRGLKEVSLDLPPRLKPNDAFLVFDTTPAGHPSKDWTFWSDPEIK